jgi:ribonuclease D
MTIMDGPLASRRSKATKRKNTVKHVQQGSQASLAQDRKGKRGERRGLPERKKIATEPAKENNDDMVTISKEHIAQLPLIHWEGPVRVLNTVAEMREAVQEILESGETHLGFDTETKPVFRRGDYNRPALVQLATATTVYLFRICKINHSFVHLLPLLTDHSILKTGVSILDDVKELQRVERFAAAGFVDCSTVTVKQLRIRNTGLRALTAHFMQGRISKGPQMSNWASPEHLTASQIRYAATDAWTSRQVYIHAVAAAAATVTSTGTATATATALTSKRK